MRSIGALPKSVLILEILGMILLAAALLSLNQYLTLPVPMNSPLTVTVMIFLGILLMLPAAVALMWRIAQLIAPQLMTRSPDSSSRSAREKPHDSNH
ncbi:YbjC family protein [Citrobacter sp. CK189]|uniref:YbjC family protein n=1 Tax=Citrobacter sp. CK189 TaxID=2985098 RepID=UPI002576C2CC|nr:YbjC family protein [Citrobacter sp. CK189]MDM3016090.1 YbjC family protein [Citrobacter sp. CK189]